MNSQNLEVFELLRDVEIIGQQFGEIDCIDFLSENDARLFSPIATFPPAQRTL